MTRPPRELLEFLGGAGSGKLSTGVLPSPAEPRHRDTCNVCGMRIEDPAAEFVRIRCNVRRFAHEYFHMWRCRRCRCIHCWEHVNLDKYYEDYGSQRMHLDFFLKLAYRQLYRHFRNAGMRRDHRFLDYGCGAGHFVTYLRGRGHLQAVGYDPYGRPDGWIDRLVLKPEAYDFINLYDVVEHVEKPTELLSELAGLLRPGGALLVGTPSADEIDLRLVHEYLHHLHVPYHLHIYTRGALSQMARALGMEPIAYYRRYYLENLFFGMNEAFLRRYMEKADDTIDALLDPLRYGMIFSSPTLIFHGAFGYFYGRRHSMTVVYRKHA